MFVPNWNIILQYEIRILKMTYRYNFCSNDDFFFKVGIHYQRVVLYNGLQPIESSSVVQKFTNFFYILFVHLK